MIFNISAAQYPILKFNSVADWIQNIEAWIIKAKNENSNICLFPEYGSLDLTSLIPENSKINSEELLQNQLHELQKFHSVFLDTFITFAKKYSIYIVAPSFPIRVGSKFYNRAYFIAPSGHYHFQDKIHMTRFEDEDWGISASESTLKVFETNLGQFGIQICFDIEFPWASHLLASHGVDTILVPSCTEGLAGMHRVHTGAKARALENQLYVVVSHTVGEALWSPAVDRNTGEAIAFSTSDQNFPATGILNSGNLNSPQWLTTTLDLNKIEAVRKNGQVFNFNHSQKYPWNSPTDFSIKIEKVSLK